MIKIRSTTKCHNTVYNEVADFFDVCRKRERSAEIGGGFLLQRQDDARDIAAMPL